MLFSSLPLQVHYENDPRQRYLQLLGYNSADVSKKVADLTSAADTSTSTSLTNGSPPAAGGVDASELADKMAGLDTNVQVITNFIMFNICFLKHDAFCCQYVSFICLAISDHYMCLLICSFCIKM